MRMWKAIAVAAGAMVGISCAGVSSGRKVQDLEVRVAGLENSNAELSRQLDELNTRLQMLQARNSVAPPAVSSSAAVPAPAPGPPVAGPVPPNLEVVKLKRGAPGEAKTFSAWPEQPVFRNGTGKKVSLPKASASAGPDEPEAEAKPADKVKPADRGFVNYQDAMQLFSDKKFAEAIVRFQQITEDRAASSLHDNALYWIGECYYNLDEFGKAIEEFVHLANDYPESDKAPDALYKAGLSYQELGQSEAALATLREVVILYPFSDSARLAEEKIKDLSR